jgi:glutamyl-tRNA synthetase
MADVRVRFAPSPTGYLHIGGVRTALFNWLYARKTGGTFVLRIEDTDQERSTPESKAIILESLRWLGLTWDEGPEVGGSHGPYVQTERLGLYREHAEKLIAAGKAYRCTCTKADLDAQREALKARDPKANFKYPGTCRDANHPASSPHVVRFKVPTEGVVTYVDKVFGEIKTPNGAQQDFVLLRTDGVPLYNFGAVVDDITMGITLVARGRDHMVNTPPQILVYEALGAPVPEFAHLPMMLAPSGEKLSKRHGAVSVTEYREKGYTPEGVLNYLVRFGWSCGDREIFSMEELVEAFTWETCGRGDGKFDAKKFLAVNHEHMKQERLQSAHTYAERAKPFLVARGLELPASDDHLRAALATVRERSRTFVEAAEGVDFYFRAEPVVDEAAATKFLVAQAAERLSGFTAAIAAVSSWDAKTLEAAVHAWLEAAGLQIKDVAQAARVALTGRSASPGLFEVLEVLGRDASLARLEGGRARAASAPVPAPAE